MGDRCWIGGWFDAESLHKVYAEKGALGLDGLPSMFWFDKDSIQSFLKRLPKNGRVYLEEDDVNYAGGQHVKELAEAGVKFNIRNSSGGDYTSGDQAGDGRGNYLAHEDDALDMDSVLKFAKLAINKEINSDKELEALFVVQFDIGKIGVVQMELQKLKEINKEFDGSFHK